MLSALLPCLSERQTTYPAGAIIKSSLRGEAAIFRKRHRKRTLFIFLAESFEFWPFSKGCFPHSWWHAEFGIRLLEFCKAFEVQTENTHSQSDCGYDQIRLYELTLSCRSLQTETASSICKTPTLRGWRVYPHLPIRPKGAWRGDS